MGSRDADSLSDAMHVRSMLESGAGVKLSTVFEADELNASMHENEVLLKEAKDAGLLEGEVNAIRKVLEQVNETVKKRKKEGMHEVNFALGVLNSFLMMYVFGAYPEHFWLLYFVESCYLLPRKFYFMVNAKPLNEAFYYADLCWFLNFLIIGMMSLMILASYGVLEIPREIRFQIYDAVVGFSLGPLTGATAALPFVAFLFHDVRTMTGLFIHLYPPFLAYTMMWKTDALREAWPGIFTLDYLQDVSFISESGFPLKLGTIAGNGVAIYTIWFMVYVTWMVTVGMDLPRKVRRTKGPDGQPLPPKYDTVFHSTVRGGLCIVMGKALWGRKKEVSLKQIADDDYEMRDFFVYMAAHAVAGVTSTCISGYLCFTYQKFHAAVLVFLIYTTVMRGAKRYTFYINSMYGRMIWKQFKDSLDKSEKSK